MSTYLRKAVSFILTSSRKIFLAACMDSGVAFGSADSCAYLSYTPTVTPRALLSKS